MNKASSSSVLLLLVAAIVVVVVASAALTRVFATGRGRGRGRATMTEQRKEPRVGKFTFAETTFLSRTCHVTHFPWQSSSSRSRSQERGSGREKETRRKRTRPTANHPQPLLRRSGARQNGRKPSRSSVSGWTRLVRCGSSIVHGSHSSLPRTMRERHSS